MATIGNVMNLQDWARRLDPNGRVDKIVEMQNRINRILDDMMFKPTNQTDTEKTTIRTGLPTPAWRQINKGVPVTKSLTKQVTFGCGIMEDRGELDEELVELAEDREGLRVSENVAHIEGITQELAKTVFYGDTDKNPERFTGLSAYYSTISTDETLSGFNVLSAGGSGDDNTSIYLVVWAHDTIHGIFPKASKAGIYHEPIPGKIDITDADGYKYRGYGDVFKQKAGLCVRDWRYGGRIANIDVGDLDSAGEETDTSANLIKLMIKLLNRIPSLEKGRAAWYCNREVKTALDIKAMNKASSQLTIETLANGISLTKFLGVPVRRCDAIVNNEDVVS